MVLVLEIRDPSTLFFQFTICFCGPFPWSRGGCGRFSPPHDETNVGFHLYNGTFPYNPYCKIEVFPFSTYVLFTCLVSGLPFLYVNSSVGSPRIKEKGYDAQRKKGGMLRLLWCKYSQHIASMNLLLMT